MNYRHAYHAGNFADVVKHAALGRLIDYLKQKDKAFRVIDTHAGTGLYDLSSEEAQKTGEWREGIGRIVDAPLPPTATALLEPYLDAVRDVNPEGRLTRYPGSPAIARHLMRKQDRLSAIELHPEDAGRLARHFAGDFQTRVIELDGWLALGAHLPPKERRGLVFVDPPFEKEGEFGRLADGLIKAHRRWPGGMYALWYPIKDHRAIGDFRAGLTAAGIARVLDLRFEIRPPSPEPRLDGTGLIVVNPPFTFENEMRIMLPVLHGLLAETPAARWSVDWLARERPDTTATGA